jgi:hypothetical protein
MSLPLNLISDDVVRAASLRSAGPRTRGERASPGARPAVYASAARPPRISGHPVRHFAEMARLMREP